MWYILLELLLLGYFSVACDGSISLWLFIATEPKLVVADEVTWVI